MNDNQNKINLSLDLDNHSPEIASEITPLEIMADDSPKPEPTPAIELLVPISRDDETPLTAQNQEMAMPDLSKFTPAELKAVEDFTAKIDITNSTQMLQYGGAAQQKVASFSTTALENVRTKDLDEVGSLVTNMTTKLQSFNFEDEGKKRLFSRTRDKLALKKAEFDSVSKNIDKISTTLEKHKIKLMKDIHLLDQMYDKNLEYYKELTMYIAAGRKKLKHILEVELVELTDKAKSSGLLEDATYANQISEACTVFDKKLHDLELTRMISIQMSPQIRIVQTTNNALVEKINSSIVNVIPLWKNQMVLALGMANSQKALRAQREVTDMTNELLRKNADMLKMNAVETAKESERAIVDVETLKHTNQTLISTLDEVVQIQREGFAKRQEASAELHKIEGELKSKLLAIRDGQS